MHSKRHRLVDLRKQEYSNKVPRQKQKPTKNTGPQYPCADLDFKTKVYIDQLRARNAFLEKAMSHLQQGILQETRHNPISLIKSIEAGAQDDLTMQLVRDNQEQNGSVQLKVLQTAVSKLLDLADNDNCPLEMQERDGKNFSAGNALLQRSNPVCR